MRPRKEMFLTKFSYLEKIELCKKFNKKSERIFKYCVKMYNKPGEIIINNDGKIKKSVEELNDFLSKHF